MAAPPTLSDPAGRRVHCGRFAPSPTGPLHFGSLVSAVASYLQVRRQGGRWLVRIEDIDPPREVPGATDAILTALEHYGFAWDGPVLYQSDRSAAYQAALEQLAATGQSYPCSCSRREIAEGAEDGIAGPVYPGTCRTRPRHRNRNTALRLRTSGTRIGFCDGHFGGCEIDLERDFGDFVIRRADGLFAYQLAVVVDDAAQGVTEVVRGADLLDLTPAQLHLQRLLGLPAPTYLHHPLAIDPAGAKLSKQTGARPLDGVDPRPDLLAALAFLDQAPPPELTAVTLDSLWDWALARWDPTLMPRPRTAPAPTRYDM
ncbi:MAG: tRNA glutamyl-Q(34) synthetase GluQRS [Gammaproteobacteria bacterium]|nr:MAG: tRNA glutamyl-Q(34) synthetase GluQRS [Gammaproteobacteria bacterium]